MACAPALPADFARQPDLNDAHATRAEPGPARRRCCSRKPKAQKQPSKLAAHPTRGMAVAMGIASALALTVALLQLADGQTGKMAAQTLYVASGFNVLFTLLYAPLIAVFTLRAGFFRAIGALVCTLLSGLAYTLGLLFVSAVVLVGLASVFG